MNYNIVLIKPQGYAHTPALWEAGCLLFHTFTSLGHSTSININQIRADSINVVLGYHLLRDVKVFGDSRVVFYQLEQLFEGGNVFQPYHLDILKRAEAIWDYSTQNMDYLRAKGFRNVKYLPFGFHEGMKTIPEAAKEIDVLFYGSISPRRRQILDRLATMCRLRTYMGVYGPERDALIARSRIVLNMHVREVRIMEQARVSYLLNNACFVVSESSPDDPFGGMMVTAALQDIPAACSKYLADEENRRRVAQRGFELFRQRPMTQYVSAVLTD